MDINSQIKNLMKQEKRLKIASMYLVFNIISGVLSYVYLTFIKNASFDIIFIFGPGLFFYFSSIFIVLILLNPLSIVIFIIPHIILYPLFYQLFNFNSRHRLIIGLVFIILWFLAGQLIFEIMIDAG